MLRHPSDRDSSPVELGRYRSLSTALPNAVRIFQPFNPSCPLVRHVEQNPQVDQIQCDALGASLIRRKDISAVGQEAEQVSLGPDG